MIAFRGTVWRIVFSNQTDIPLASARAPQGRFHHSGQKAVYTSLTQDGARIAIQRYLSPNDPPRVIIPIAVGLTRVRDLRNQPNASVIWQDIVKMGQTSPTWGFSDQARAEGAQAILYSSRSRPDLSHLMLIDTSKLHAGKPVIWHPSLE